MCTAADAEPRHGNLNDRWLLDVSVLGLAIHAAGGIVLLDLVDAWLRRSVGTTYLGTAMQVYQQSYLSRKSNFVRNAIVQDLGVGIGVASWRHSNNMVRKASISITHRKQTYKGTGHCAVEHQI